MRISAEQLPAALTKTGAVVLISGTELLLIEEALDAVRALAKSQGFSEREAARIDKDDEFDIDSATEQLGSMSLFAQQRLIEWRFNRTPAAKTRTALPELLERLNSDTLLLIVAPDLDKKAREATWVQQIEKAGTHITADAIANERLPAWLQQRAQRLQIKLDAPALQYLCQCCEGNLLAAQQTLQHLALLFIGQHPQQALSLSDVAQVASADARYDIYAVVDTAFSGDAARALRMISALRAEDEAGALRQLLSALQRDMRTLVAVSDCIEQGQSPDMASKSAGVWFKRQKPFASAARHVRLRGARQLLRLAFDAECMMKGAQTGEPWQNIERILVRCAGAGTRA